MLDQRTTHCACDRNHTSCEHLQSACCFGNLLCSRYWVGRVQTNAGELGNIAITCARANRTYIAFKFSSTAFPTSTHHQQSSAMDGDTKVPRTNVRWARRIPQRELDCCHQIVKGKMRRPQPGIILAVTTLVNFSRQPGYSDIAGILHRVLTASGNNKGTFRTQT
jgi:hypothetical protein